MDFKVEFASFSLNAMNFIEDIMSSVSELEKQLAQVEDGDGRRDEFDEAQQHLDAGKASSWTEGYDL